MKREGECASSGCVRWDFPFRYGAFVVEEEGRVQLGVQSSRAGLGGRVGKTRSGLRLEIKVEMAWKFAHEVSS